MEARAVRRAEGRGGCGVVRRRGLLSDVNDDINNKFEDGIFGRERGFASSNSQIFG